MGLDASKPDYCMRITMAHTIELVTDRQTDKSFILLGHLHDI